MFLNSIPQTPNLVLCTLQKAIQKKRKKQKKRNEKEKEQNKNKKKRNDYFTRPRKCSTNTLAG